MVAYPANQPDPIRQQPSSYATALDGQSYTRLRHTSQRAPGCSCFAIHHGRICGHDGLCKLDQIRSHTHHAVLVQPFFFNNLPRLKPNC